ncbi:protein adenylyltransferase SelO [Candidatus Odyssella thessalonicensis]|uniref:protein adenylyltransferase SelO n=1 Tax=Candidatus Odyssella thessalonicensis TaxID=84647 RepID=UPI000225BEBC|nr:YdiU family protein [Candidatus Odyssella thessalonicensis]
MIAYTKKHNVLRFENSYLDLPDKFYQHIAPTPVNKPEILLLNTDLAAELGLNLQTLTTDKITAIFSGNHVPKGTQPIALAYAGHQFGHFVPQLGDGRAILLGEIIDIHGKRRDIQLKGSGRTQFSRRGDGRAALGPVLREYIISEAMQALGITTTRSLAVIKSGELVRRETLLPGAVLTRVASSHIRIGTFEYFAARQDVAALKLLADYAIDRHYPDAKHAANPYLYLLKAVIQAQAYLVAKWMQVGFIHGVMNTDNTSITGETIDYGPCAFMDTYDPNTVYSSIDYYGRYAYANQPPIAQWNIGSLIECLLFMLAFEEDQAKQTKAELIQLFQTAYQEHWLNNMASKLGLSQPSTVDLPLIQEFLRLMRTNKADYTLSFYYLRPAIDAAADSKDLKNLLGQEPGLETWLKAWRARLSQENQNKLQTVAIMAAANPVFIPRNHRVEQAIKAAVEHNDLSLAKRLISVLSRPYVEQPENYEYMLPPSPGEEVLQTFCGT